MSFPLDKKCFDIVNEVKIHFQDKNAVKTLSQYLQHKIKKNTIVVCIGTDRCIGDCLGPLVGTFLTSIGFKYPVYGTLKNPIHAINLNDQMKKIYTLHINPHIIAIDACLGEENFIGNIHIRKGPIFPGKGVGKSLPSVGDLSIVGIVDKFAFNDFLPIHNIRLSLVMEMAELIAKAFMEIEQ